MEQSSIAVMMGGISLSPTHNDSNTGSARSAEGVIMTKQTEIKQSVEYLKAQDEAKDNTRISRYVFGLSALFLTALFGTYFYSLAGKGESLLSSELVHFIAGALFTGINVILDRYFKSGNQKETEKDVAYLVGKLKQQEQNQGGTP